MASKVFRCTHRVSYAECTVGNHVYHSRFLDMLERARGEFFHSLSWGFLQLQEQEAVFLVTDCRMRFLSMARYDDLLTVELWLSELRRARCSCAGRIRNSVGAVVHESVVQLACTTLVGRPRRMPAQLADRLRAYLVPEEVPDSLQ
jgi:acyl-CoA thioester hydrolase